MAKIRNIIIVGAGGFGREVASWIEHLSADAGVTIAGFLDDTKDPCAALSADYPYPVLGPIASYEPQPGDGVVVAIGDPRAKLRIAYSLAERGARFYNVIHPTAVVARTAMLGQGVILCPFSLVSASATVANYVTVNAYGGVGHDVVIGEGSTICAHVDLTGGVQLDEGVFVGSNASILPGVDVGAFAVIGAGTVVLRRVEAGTTMYAPLSRKL